MRKEDFHKVLDQFYDWRVTADTIGKNENGTKRKIRKDHSEPEKGYEVVLAHKPREYTCEWCDGTCSKEKTYSRSLTTGIWRAKCQDCGQVRNPPRPFV